MFEYLLISCLYILTVFQNKHTISVRKWICAKFNSMTLPDKFNHGTHYQYWYSRNRPSIVSYVSKSTINCVRADDVEINIADSWDILDNRSFRTKKTTPTLAHIIHNYYVLFYKTLYQPNNSRWWPLARAEFRNNIADFSYFALQTSCAVIAIKSGNFVVRFSNN